MSESVAKTLLVNAITLSRVPLIFGFAILAMIAHFSGSMSSAVLACVCAAAAGFSDLFDGMLARKWNVVSDFGKMADPLMDKIYFIVAFPLLLWLASVQGESTVHAVALTIFTILWIARDQWVTFLRSVASSYHADVAAMQLGKIRTALSFPSAGFVYVYLAFHSGWSENLRAIGLQACLWIEAALILLNLVSFVVYTKAYMPYLKKALDRS